jgi:hypothetical protein
MSTVSEDLDWVQRRLHDSGTIWTRAELLDWYNSGYRNLCWQTKAVRRFQYYDLPPRYAFTQTFDWETQFTNHAPARVMTHTFHDRTYACTSVWEVALFSGMEPSDALPGMTQDWERTHLGDVDHHYVFALPHHFELLLDVRWNNRPLNSVSVREFDETDDKWMQRVGEPWWYTSGTSRNNTIEVYEIETDYQQAYSAIGFDAYGFPRLLSGDRTYAVTSNVRQSDYTYTASGDVPNPLTGFGWRCTVASSSSKMCVYVWEQEWLDGETVLTDSGTRGTYGWESQHGVAVESFGLGIMRDMTSEDRQYLGYGTGLSFHDYYGGVRNFASSDSALELLLALVPDTDLGEDDTPWLVPLGCQKYLRYFTLSRAFGRQGPGQRTDLSQHYLERVVMGVAFWSSLVNAASSDQVHVRESTSATTGGRPPHVRLPANYEDAW